MSRIFAFFSFFLLSACTAVQYDLPPVSAKSDGAYRPGKFIWHDLISDDVAGSQQFYSGLFGWEFRKLPLLNADYWIVSLDGQAIGGMVDQGDLAARKDVSQWVSVLSVGDAALARDTVVDLGGRVLREPVSVGKRGVIGVYMDRSGAIFSALQTPDGDAPDATVLPAEGAFFWHELWTGDVDDAVVFYSGLTGLSQTNHDAEHTDGQSVKYRILRDSQSPRAGVRSLPDDDMPTLWMPYLRVSSKDRLATLIKRVEVLGGKVLVPAVARPAGGFVAVIAGPSGAPIALQTWTDEQPDLGEL